MAATESQTTTTCTSDPNGAQQTIPLQLLEQTESRVFAVDFGFLPIPKRLRYDPHKAFHFGLWLNIAFGVASTFGMGLH